MAEELKNYLPLDRLSLCYKFYAFLDVPEYYADALFVKHRVQVKFLQEYAKQGSDYLIIFCRVRKKDEAAFLSALQELPNKMILCGHGEYESACRDLMRMLDSVKKGGTVSESDGPAAKAKQAGAKRLPYPQKGQLERGMPHHEDKAQ